MPSGESAEEKPDNLTPAGVLVFRSPLQRGVGGVNENKTMFPCRTAESAEEVKAGFEYLFSSGFSTAGW